jgi:hypothetical protein
MIHGAGSIYSLSHNTTHTAHPRSSSELTATLFLRGAPVIASDTIARKHMKAATADSARPKVRLSTTEIIDELGTVVDIPVMARVKALIAMARNSRYKGSAK